MNEATPGRRTCEVCGRPIHRNNTTGVCVGIGSTTECRRVRAEKIRRAQGAKPKVRKICGHPDGCPSPATRNGFCVMHDARRRTTGDLGPAGFVHKPMVFMVGDVYGKWTVMENYDAADYRVLCRCECGTERRVLVATLRNGNSKSCGCVARAKSRGRRSPGPFMKPGDTFGRLTILEPVEHPSDLVLVRCECGTVTKKRAMSIKGGNTRSCGCLGRETHRTHGLSGHPLWSTWTGMIDRTTKPRNASWKHYGARGITVCAGWSAKPDGFLAFIADVGERPEGCSIDRPDNDAGYFCGHCEECTRLGRPRNWAWKTRQEQTANRRSVLKLTRERDDLLAKLEQMNEALAAAAAPRQRGKAAAAALQDGLF